MLVHIIGPNLPDQTKGDFHVHAKGCADVARLYGDFDDDVNMTWDVSNKLDAAAQTYADQIAEGTESPETAVGTMWFAPCCDDLPERAERVLLVVGDLDALRYISDFETEEDAFFYADAHYQSSKHWTLSTLTEPA